jgi:hypothetical protein
VLQDLQPAEELAGLHRELGERGTVRAPPLHRRGDGRAGLLVAAERVEQVALPVLVQ